MGLKPTGVPFPSRNWLLRITKPDYQYQEQYSYRKTIPGDLKFVDQDGDGRVNKVYGNHEDKIVLGCSRPDFEGGFNTRLSWKGFTLSIQGTFSYGDHKRHGRQRPINSVLPPRYGERWTSLWNAGPRRIRIAITHACDWFLQQWFHRLLRL